MRISKLEVCTLVFCSTLLLSVGTASAQTGISLTGTRQTVTFTGEGHDTPTCPDCGSEVGLTFGTCAAGHCTLKGTGSGYMNTAEFTITSTLGSILATMVSPNTWSLSDPTNAPIDFSFGGTATHPNSSLLSGTLNLLDFTYTQGPGKNGYFDETGIADLTITGGSLSSLFTSAGGILQLNLTFGATAKNISTLLGTTSKVGGNFAGGNVSPTPEPSAFAIFLVGSAMLVVGSLMKRRKALPNVQ